MHSTCKRTCLEVMKELNFGVGDGNLHYYLYNWRIQSIEARDCGRHGFGLIHI